MKDLVHRYWKLVLGQVLGFMVSWGLVNYVFLGPLPIVQPAFRRSVAHAPERIVESIRALPHNISLLASAVRSRQPTDTVDESDPLYPAPYVFNIPVNDTQLTPVPLVTAVPTPTITSLPQVTRRPTASVTQPPSPTQRPTRAPTQRPPEMTQPPAEPSAPPLNPQQMEEQTLTLINQRRSENGAGPVGWNTSLQQAARSHALWVGEGPAMAHCNHQDAQGKWPDDRAREAGYTQGGVGEIIACRVRTPEEAVDGWMHSPRHKAILINPTLHDIGIGWGGPYSVALFGG